MKCPTCGELRLWHIVGGLENPVDTAAWHKIVEGFFKPSDLFDFTTGEIKTQLKMPTRRGRLTVWSA